MTLLHFLMPAIECAVPMFPGVNARYHDESSGNITGYGAVHVGIATQTKGAPSYGIRASLEQVERKRL